ncbi:MAG: arginine--tRNA ligase [Clostridia bacterium]|nr:arginine--tRNA ligase [Clostridia bacterium]
MRDQKAYLGGLLSGFLADRGIELSAAEAANLFEKPADAKMGDLALPCFRLAKSFRMPPPAIASELAERFQGAEGVEKAEAVNGYLNFFFDSASCIGVVKHILADASFGSSDEGNGRVICLDFSSPNIAKRFHLGHLGTTVIGNSLRNIFRFMGYRTVAINYLGDWGTQFGKLIYAYLNWSSRERVEAEGIHELERLYVKFCSDAEQDPELNQKARDAFHRLEMRDPDYLEIWSYFKEISLREYQKTYALLGIDFDSYNGESFYSDKMPAVVEEMREKNLLELDNGASVVRLDEENMPPCLILKSDGSTLYPTRDIAAALWRKQEYGFDKCLYVTSAGQSLHFAQWFRVLEKMGYGWAKDGLVHVPYGTMSVNGEKLASRTGNVVLLEDLLAEAIRKCEEVIDQKHADLKDRHDVAEAVGVGAVVFNALANSRIKDSDFNWEEALSFEGNSGPYVQYTYARTSSVLRKSGEEVPMDETYQPIAEETTLVNRLSEFPSVVRRAMNEYEPSLISRYLLSVCALYNQFYHDCRILNAEENARGFRLCLSAAARTVIGNGLDLLGIRRTEEI